MEALLPIALFVGIALLIVGAIVWSYIAENKRREALQLAAEELGLTYLKDGDPRLMGVAERFTVCSTGRSRKMYNLIQGETDELTIAIFDFRYTTGGGKNSTTHVQTIVMLRSNKLENPPFTMRPEGFFDRIGGMLGFDDIDFESHPKFSDSFVLKSPDEEATREFFNASLLEFFEGRLGISVEANSGAMIFYRPRVRSKPAELKTLFAEAYEVFGAMVDRGK